jgi:hypothetical protein
MGPRVVQKNTTCAPVRSRAYFQQRRRSSARGLVQKVHDISKHLPTQREGRPVNPRYWLFATLTFKLAVQAV